MPLISLLTQLKFTICIYLHFPISSLFNFCNFQIGSRTPGPTLATPMGLGHGHRKFLDFTIQMCFGAFGRLVGHKITEGIAPIKLMGGTCCCSYMGSAYNYGLWDLAGDVSGTTRGPNEIRLVNMG